MSKFYKNGGFYETYQVNSVEIGDEYWQALLQGQSQGKQIVADENGKPVLKAYEVTFEQAKANKLQEINQAREQARLDEGAVYGDDTYDIDDKAQSNILAKVTTASLSSDDSIFTYRSKTNITHTFTKAEIIALGLAIGDKIDKVYEKSWLLKKKVDEANTVEEVEAIKWNM